MELQQRLGYGDGGLGLGLGLGLAAIMSNGSNAWNLFTRGASLPASDIVLHSPQLKSACALWVFIEGKIKSVWRNQLVFSYE